MRRNHLTAAVRGLHSQASEHVAIAQREARIDKFCLALPILPGHSDDARAFMAELEGERKPQYAASERRIGITKEAWYLAPLPAGDHLIAYMESADIQRAIGAFIGSQDEFDLGFKRRLLETTGLDMHNLPADGEFPKLLSAYAA